MTRAEAGVLVLLLVRVRVRVRVRVWARARARARARVLAILAYEVVIGCSLIHTLSSLPPLPPPPSSPSPPRTIQVLVEQFRASPLKCGKLVCFDEAHKYLGDKSSELATSIVDAVRLMRHDGLRVAISTQVGGAGVTIAWEPV